MLVRRVATQMWWLILLEGIAVLILGVMLFINPVITTIGLVQAIGLYWFASGIFALIGIFVESSSHSMWWMILYAIISILAGLSIMIYPVTSAIVLPTFLTICFGIAGFVLGISSIAQALTGRGPALFLLGVVDIVIGALIFWHFYAAMWAIIYVIAVVGVIAGILMIVWSFRIRQQMTLAV